MVKSKNIKRKKIVITVGIILLVIIASIVTLVVISERHRFEEETQFGGWGQEIYFEIADGSIEPMASSSLLSFLKDDKEVVAINYVLSAKASGIGYNNIEIDLSNYVLSWNLKDVDSSAIIHTWDDSAVSGDYSNYFTTKTIPLDDKWHALVNIRHETDFLAPPAVPYGLYTFEIDPSGFISYSPDGEPDINAILPSKLSAQIEIQDDRTVTVDFGQDVTYGEGDYLFEQALFTPNENIVTFSENIISQLTDTSIETVFASVEEHFISILYYDEVEDHWYSWYKDRDPWYNDLIDIVSGKYYVYVSQDCVLQIS